MLVETQSESQKKGLNACVLYATRAGGFNCIYIFTVKYHNNYNVSSEYNNKYILLFNYYNNY